MNWIRISLPHRICPTVTPSLIYLALTLRRLMNDDLTRFAGRSSEGNFRVYIHLKKLPFYVLMQLIFGYKKMTKSSYKFHLFAVMLSRTESRLASFLPMKVFMTAVSATRLTRRRLSRTARHISRRLKFRFAVAVDLRWIVRWKLNGSKTWIDWLMV